MIRREFLQINRPAPDDKITRAQCAGDFHEIGLFVIKSDRQYIRPPCLIFFDTVDFFQDSPYPALGSSGKTAGNLQLNNFFRGGGRTPKQCRRKKHHYNNHKCFFHQRPSILQPSQPPALPVAGRPLRPAPPCCRGNFH